MNLKPLSHVPLQAGTDAPLLRFVSCVKIERQDEVGTPLMRFLAGKGGSNQGKVIPPCVSSHTSSQKVYNIQHIHLENHFIFYSIDILWLYHSQAL